VTRTTPSPAVVIGAGPYGLSVAAHLRGSGVPTRTFGDVMTSWRNHMPVGMLLKSTPNASSMSAPRPGCTLHDFCRISGLPHLAEEEQVSCDLFIRYGQWFQQQLVPDVESAQVCELARSGGQFHIKLDSGEELETATVVIASGLISFPYLPPEFAAAVPDGPSPDAILSHSSQHHDLTGFAGRRVAVIGAGQSALEGAALLHEAGASVHVLAREKARFGDPPKPVPAGGLHLPQPNSPLGPSWGLYPFSHAAACYRFLPENVRLSLVKKVLGPLGAWWLKDRVAGQFPVTDECRVTQIRDDGGKALLTVAGQDGTRTTQEFDHVIAATGYRVELDRITYLSPEVRARLRSVAGSPRLSPTLESSVPGLYFAGMAAAATFGPLMRFVCGTAFAAPRVSAAAARRSRAG